MAKGKTEATTRITGGERIAINGTISVLIARHRLAHRCPLTPEELCALWRANMGKVDLNFWSAAFEMARSGSDLPFYMPSAQGVLLHFDFGKVCLEIPDDVFEAGNFPFWDRCRDMSFVDPRGVLSTPERYREFSDWALTAIHIRTRSEMTRTILMRLLAISNTVGQLNRMAPELVKYASGLTQQALGEQERRSPLPDEWMTIDRTVVRSSLDHLAFCYLLPKSSGVSLDDMTWCWDGPGTDNADSSARPRDGNLEKQLSTYKLPKDSNPMALGTFSHSE